MQETEDIVTRLEEPWAEPAKSADDEVQKLYKLCRKAATTIATLRAEVEGLRWRSVDDELPPMNTEVLVAFDTRPLPATAQLTMHKGMRQWLWPAENDATEGEEPVSVTHWMPLPDHPNEERFAAIDAAKADKKA